jgi:hypothetical protein
MGYRDNSNGTEPRCNELLGEIEIVQQRSREYPYLEWKKKELVRELEIVSSGRYKAPRSDRETFLASLRFAAKCVGAMTFVLIVLIVSLAAVVKYIGPQVSKAGTQSGGGLQPY